MSCLYIPDHEGNVLRQGMLTYLWAKEEYSDLAKGSMNQIGPKNKQGSPNLWVI